MISDDFTYDFSTREIRWAPGPIQMSWPFSGWRHDWVPNDMTPDRYTMLDLQSWLLDQPKWTIDDDAKRWIYEGGD